MEKSKIKTSDAILTALILAGSIYGLVALFQIIFIV